jgi:glycosyltransferase involved in cell wall biosynthesis
MNDVLIVAYHYPPIASGGTERALSLVRHLPSQGYRPHVLTTDAFGDEGPGSVYRAGEAVGLYRKLFNRASQALPSHTRSRSRTESSLTPLARLARSVLIPDGQIGWLPSAYRAARHILNTHPIRLILTTGPPFSAHLLGLALHQTTCLPWVADYRDAWTYDPLDPHLNTSRVRLSLEKGLERLVLKAATHVTCATDVCSSYLRRVSPTSSVSLVPNGYADADVVQPNEASNGDRIRFVHTGSFSASHSHRSPAPLVEAAKQLRDEADFELVFVGHLTDEEERMIEPLVDSGHAVLTGPVPREQALEWQSRADVLLVVDHPREVMASNIPGKVYEYGAAGKPILGIASRGATRQLIRDSGSGLCVGHEPGVIAGAMRAMIGGEANLSPNLAWWKRFERKEGVRQMAGVFDEILRR